MRIIKQVSKPPLKKFFLPPKDILCIAKKIFRQVSLGNAFLYKHYLINVIGGDEGKFNNRALSGPLERTGGHIGLINPQQNVLHLFLFLEHASCKIQLRNKLCYIYIFITCAIFLFSKNNHERRVSKKSTIFAGLNVINFHFAATNISPQLATAGPAFVIE